MLPVFAFLRCVCNTWVIYSDMPRAFKEMMNLSKLFSKMTGTWWICTKNSFPCFNLLLRIPVWSTSYEVWHAATVYCSSLSGGKSIVLPTPTLLQAASC